MKAENNELHIADARDAFKKWNTMQYNEVIKNNKNSIIPFVSLIPLLFQLNNKLLPGYTDMDTPIGVCRYKPDNKAIQQAKSLNNRFMYRAEGIIKNYAVEAIYFNKKIINNKLSCWVFYRQSLNNKQIKLLKDKVNKIEKWFSSRGAAISFFAFSIDGFKENKKILMPYKNRSIYLNEYYSEMILMAGKYPVWWLVPPDEETHYDEFVKHIKEFRYVDSEEFIDIGGLDGLQQSDIIESANVWVKNTYKTPELSLSMLLYFNVQNTTWPVLDGLSIRLKKEIYQNGGVGIEPVYIFSGMMKESFSTVSAKHKGLSPLRMFQQLKRSNVELNKEIIESFVSNKDVSESALKGVKNIISYLNLYKSITYYIRQTYQHIFQLYKKQHVDESEDSITHENMAHFLSTDENKISLYNNKNKTDIVLDRVHLRQESGVNSGKWSLVLAALEDDETAIDGFNSILGLLAWCWLNRIVNESTQVSIESEARKVKQVEAYFVLETLLREMSYKWVSDIPSKALDSQVRPLRSIVFVNFLNAMDADVNLKDDALDPFGFEFESRDQTLNCEQLIINSWGELHTKRYFGDEGVLHCLCDWTHHAPINGLSKPQKLNVFGYGEGSSTYVAQRIMQIYEDMYQFFYFEKHNDGRYVIRMGTEYYLVGITNDVLLPLKIGSKASIIKCLEKSLVSYQSTAIEKMAFLSAPLREIYSNNKENKIQVFFQVINRSCHSWVLDEKGSLWVDVVEVYDRDSYLAQWLYLIKSISRRYASDLSGGSEKADFFPLEVNQISINQLGGVDIILMKSDAFTNNKNFIELKVKVVSEESGDDFSLQCDGNDFSYAEYKDNVMLECVQYIQARIVGEGRRSIYVTDIDVPLTRLVMGEMNHLQVSHILKFKRNIEHKLNKMLDGH